MGLFDFIKKIFAPPAPAPNCPFCGFSYRWDGRTCGHCGYPTPAPGAKRAGPAPASSSSSPAPAGQTARSQPNAPLPPPKNRTLGNLDPGAFVAMTPEQIREQARKIGSPWTNPWFGRRDRIPPAVDPRTKLIDAGMVGQGYITAEELKSIHDIGAQMDAIRKDLDSVNATAQLAAETAVARDKETRERIKAERKAEAAERKKQRAEKIAARRANDIIFLGRGVSGGLADRRVNVEKLQAAGLPVLATPADVASALGLSIKRLRWLAFHADASTRTHYVRFEVPKKSGGTRMLAAPHKEMAAAQQWVLDNILRKLATHDAAHGFVPTRSTVTNANQHVAREVVLNADLKDFFPSITFPRVRGQFQMLGYSPAAATLLALICTESPRRVAVYAGKTFHVATGPRALPQGACTSPALSNLIARRLDARYSGISKKLGWTYTRYADDLTFSTSGDVGKNTGYLLARIRHIADDEGFTVNEAKTRVQRKNAQQSVTGIVVNTRPGIRRDTVRRMRAILHRAKKEGLARQNRQNHPHFASWVRGMIAYISMVNPAQGKPLRDRFDAIDR